MKRQIGRIPEAWRPAAVFIVSFVLIALVQWFAVWDDTRLIDGHLWVPAIEKAMGGEFPVPGNLLYGYPGTTVLFPAAAIEHAFGMGTSIALRAVMTLLPAIAGAFVAMLAYILRPRTLWWVFAAWLYAFQAQFNLATPPSGLLVAFLPLLILLVLYAVERKPSVPVLSLVGAFGGVMLATRFESALYVLGAVTLYLATKRFAALYIIPLVATGVFVLLDPSLFIEGPLTHLANIFEKVLYLSGPSEYERVDPLDSLFAGGMFGVFALILAGLLLATKKLRSLPAGYLAACAAMTTVFLAALSIAEYHPSWLYAPFLAVFQLFLPLLVLDAYETLPEDGMLRGGKPAGAFLRVFALLYLGITVLAFWADIATVY